jgi:hypothetical protein
VEVSSDSVNIRTVTESIKATLRHLCLECTRFLEQTASIDTATAAAVGGSEN